MLTTQGCTGGGTRACSWSPAQRRQEEEENQDGRPSQVTSPLSTQQHGSSAARTADGSLSEKASRQMLQASSHASWTPPSTKAAADECFSICAADAPASIPTSPSFSLSLSLSLSLRDQNPGAARSPSLSLSPCNTNAGSGSSVAATPKPANSKQHARA